MHWQPIDAKAARPSEAHVVQVMLYMLFLHLRGTVTKGKTVTEEVYCGEEHTVPIAAGATGTELKELVEASISRVTAKTPPRKVPSANECRFCPIPREYGPERVET